MLGVKIVVMSWRSLPSKQDIEAAEISLTFLRGFYIFYNIDPTPNSSEWCGEAWWGRTLIKAIELVIFAGFWR